MTRTFVHSDLHLKPGEKNEIFHDFLDICEYEKPDMIIELGDIDELIWFTLEEIITADYSSDIFHRRKKIARDIPTLAVPGNHNPGTKAYFMPIYAYKSMLWPIQLTAPQITIDGIRYEHGHRSDPTMHFWNFWVNQPWVKERLPWLYIQLFGSPADWKKKDQVKWSRRNALLYNLKFEYEAIQDDVHVVFGHTHQPYVKILQNGLHVGNCGDMVDSYTFIEIDNDSDNWMELRWMI